MSIEHLSNVQWVARRIGIPLDEWPDREDMVAYQVSHVFEIGSYADGHYLGLVDPDAPRFGVNSKLPMQGHSWIELPDGTIVDPTRWVFENVEPYVALIAPTDARHHDYDVTCARWVEGIYRRRPEPSDERQVGLLLPFNPRADICLLLDLKLEGAEYPECVLRVSHEQAVWLAELPPNVLDPLVVEQLYGALMAAGMRDAIPLEQWDAVTRGRELSHVDFLLLDPCIQAVTEFGAEPRGYAEFLVENFQPVIDGTLDMPLSFYSRPVGVSGEPAESSGREGDPKNPTDSPEVAS
jgi:hypothetical protein